jgi:hypothetical protein
MTQQVDMRALMAQQDLELVRVPAVQRKTPPTTSKPTDTAIPNRWKV